MSTATPRPVRGMTLLVVLMLLSVLLLGGLAMARMTEIGTLASGNNAYREASLQASEIGINTAYQAVRGLTDEETAIGGWYRPTNQATDAAGIPDIDWSGTPELTTGSYSVRYIVERLCTTAPVTDTLRQCLVRQLPQLESSRIGAEALEPPNARQFRITVRIVGPKSSETWVQQLVTKG